MMKRLIAALLLAAMLLSGCGAPAAEESVPTAPAETAAPTVPAATAPALKSYTGQVNDAVVAAVGQAELTNRQLQAWYWAEAAQYRLENHETAPDFDLPLDTQPCQIDDKAETWQEYFLLRALETWHTAQALVIRSQEVPLVLEEVYRPSDNYHEHYLTGMPATRYLYGYNPYYQLNTMHEEYLGTLPQVLETLADRNGYAGTAELAEKAFGTTREALTDWADLYNRGYMYFTAMSYDLPQTEETEEVQTAADRVTVRHILLTPQGRSEEDLAACREEAEKLLEEWSWDKRNPEFVFAELAVKRSQDTGTALNGGVYRQLRRGQLMEELDAWCFDEARLPGDIGMLTTELGVHLVYFVESCSSQELERKQETAAGQLSAILEEARQTYPMEADLSLAVLGEGAAVVAAEEVLYPDIAHERFPEVPLYLQQDYPGVPYNAYTLAGNGCGITSMAMLATYMSDEELTPPEMARRFRQYGYEGGTDSSLFSKEPSCMGFYLRERTYDWEVAKAALEAGQILVSLQQAGYWTRGGHFIVIESIDQNDMIRVRDSNIFNYIKIEAHKQDLHKWGSVLGNNGGFWIYEPKVTRIPACCRCGTGESVTGQLLTEEYLCEKCLPALLRRDTYLDR